MGEVEEDLSENHNVPVVEGEVESMMLATGRMRGDQHIMKALWVVPLCWRDCSVCLS